MSGRHLMMEDRREGLSSAGFLRHFPSTPHLDTFSKVGGVNGGGIGSENSHRTFNHATLSGASSNVNLLANSYMPKTNFSTFQQNRKPVPPPKVYGIGGSGSHGNNNGSVHNKSRYQDDPNPYKVSMIDEYRIKVNDPFLPNKSLASHRNSKMFSFYTSSEANQGDLDDDGVGEEDDDEEEEDVDVREALGQMEIRSVGGRSLYEEALSSYNGSSTSKVHRSATLKSSRSVGGGGGGEPSSRRSHHRSGSVSVSASSTGTGEIDIDGEYIIPEPDYEGFHRTGSSAGEECEATTGGSSGRGSGSGIIIPGPISDSSCNGSEGYSTVSQATSSSCSASDPDPYAVPNTGRSSSSPDEGSILEASDSGIETPTRISDKDRKKIQYALMGRKTTIFVADCLANLYCMRKSNFVSRPNSSLSNHHNNHSNGSYSGQSSSSAVVSSPDGEWVLIHTGVPVLLLDRGETKSRDKRRIQIVLVELGSGLALWKDVIDNLSSYKVMEGSQRSFHTMHLSTDHTKIIGLSFDDEECADGFYKEVDKLTSDFANISLSGSKVKSKGKKDKTNTKTSFKSKFVKPKKSEISQPCCFDHISSLTSNDKKRFPSLQNFVLGGGGSNSNGVSVSSSTGGVKSADQISALSSTHEDFVSMSPLALADSHGSDLHF